MNNSLTDDLVNFLSQCAHSIYALTENKVYRAGASELLAKLKETEGKDFSIEQFPVTESLNKITKTPYTFNFNEIARQLKWRPSPRTDFKVNEIALCTINDMLHLDGVLAGLMFMSPHQIYPEHQHSPQELYFVLSGTASWLYGGADEYRTHKPGDFIYNHPKDLHGMKTDKEYLLALYILWGNEADTYSY